MDILESYQVGKEILMSENYDLFIATSGYEARCTWLIDNYDIQAKQKIALVSEKKHHDIFKNKISKSYKDKGFLFLNLDYQNNDDLLNYLRDFLQQNEKEVLNILIDYSGMSKMWYFGLLNFFSSIDDYQSNINLYFSYTPVQYERSKKKKQIKNANSLSRSNASKSDDKPTVLVIGLGLDPGNANYINDIIKPDRTILLYPDPSPKGYIDLLFENNKEIISIVEMRNMINFPLNDLNRSMEIMTNLILSLRLKSNIILAPLGPKPFSLISMLINVYYPDIDIWQINSNMKKKEIKKQTLLSPMIFKVEFADNEDE